MTQPQWYPITGDKNCLMRLQRTRIPRAIHRTAPLLFALTVMVALGCDGSQSTTTSEVNGANGVPEAPPTTPLLTSSTEVTEPTPTRPPVDGETWILQSLDGRPVIDGTHATLIIDGPQFGGFDGCNSFGGRHESGQPVISSDGSISTPPFVRTAAGCPTDAIRDQANRFLEAVSQEAGAHVADDLLHIIDSTGEVALLLARQMPLDGSPVELSSTRWRLVDEDDIYGQRPTSLVFLDDQVALGTTACRDYTISYSASNSGIQVPYKGMAGSTNPCSPDEVRKEHQFVEDLGWANEYAVGQAAGSQRLTVRTSRGKTLSFEPVDQAPDGILSVRWRLVRFFERRQDDSMAQLTDTDVDPDIYITAAFDEKTVEGLLGCETYVYRAAGDEGTTLVRADGAISRLEAEHTTDEKCEGQASISTQRGRYLDYLAAAEQYHVFDDRLVILTDMGDALVFQSDTEEPETMTKGDLLGRLSHQERDCLGPEITSDQDLVAVLETSLTTSTEAIRCLSEENQFQLYMSNAPGPEGLNKAAHRCIWNSMAQLLELDEPSAELPTDSDLMARMMTMMVAMPLYCAATHQPALDSDHVGFDDEEAAYIICAIDAAGGREGWIKMLRGNGADFEVFLQAEKTCGQPEPQPFDQAPPEEENVTQRPHPPGSTQEPEAP